MSLCWSPLIIHPERYSVSIFLENLFLIKVKIRTGKKQRYINMVFFSLWYHSYFSSLAINMSYWYLLWFVLVRKIIISLNTKACDFFFRLYINYPEAQYALNRNSRKRVFSIDQLQTLIHKVWIELSFFLIKEN